MDEAGEHPPRTGEKGGAIVTKRVTRKPATVASKALSRRAASAPAPALATAPRGYTAWLTDVKARIHAAQQRATLAVNRELLALYWRLGRDILERQAAGAWGDGILDRVSRDLRAAFPAMKGFSRSNLKYMRAFAEAWPDAEFGQQPVGQLPCTPRRHQADGGRRVSARPGPAGRARDEPAQHRANRGGAGGTEAPEREGGSRRKAPKVTPPAPVRDCP